MFTKVYGFLLILLYGSGLWVSDILSREHIGFKLGDLTDHGICSVSQAFSCKAVAASVYSNILDLPIAVIGQAYYLMAFLLLMITLFFARHKADILKYLGATSILGAVYSLFLALVSTLDVGFLCPWCMALYLINILCFLIYYKSAHIQSQDWRPMLQRTSTWLAVGLMGASLVATQGVYAMRYEHAFKKAKRARLNKKRKASPKFHKVEVNQAPIRGESTAVTIIEFADFQCPYCRKLFRQLKTVFKLGKDNPNLNFRYAFKHYPLNSQCNPYHKNNLHPYACQLAQAAVCAEQQQQFWPMHDLLFAKQSSLSKEYSGIWTALTTWWQRWRNQPQSNIIDEQVLLSYAKELHLDLNRFQTCLSAPETRERILQDIEQAHALRIPGTPSFYVNGWGFSGAVGTKKLKELIQAYGYGILPEDKNKVHTEKHEKHTEQKDKNKGSKEESKTNKEAYTKEDTEAYKEGKKSDP